MKRQKLGWLALLVLAGCASSRARSGISLAEAIRAAIPRAQGYTAVAAGVAEDDRSFYEVAFLERGRVKQVSVDGRDGSVERIGDRGVREGSEGFARELERMLPGAGIDLARAVEIAADNASGARAIGVEIDVEDGNLVYLVTLASRSTGLRIAVDAATGAILHIQEEGHTEERAEPAKEPRQDETPE